MDTAVLTSQPQGLLHFSAELLLSLDSSFQFFPVIKVRFQKHLTFCHTNKNIKMCFLVPCFLV